MNSRKTLLLGLLLNLLACCGVAAAKEVPGLQVVPDDALVVGVMKNIKEADVKLSQLSQAAGFPLPSFLAQFKKEGIIGEGVDEQGGLFVALVTEKDGQSVTPLIFVPVTDYDKFIATFHPEKEGPHGELARIQHGDGEYAPHSLAGKKGNYAVLAQVEHGDALLAALSAKTDIRAKLAPLGDWLDAQDFAVVGTTAGIQLLVPEITRHLEKIQAVFPADSPEAKKSEPVFGVYKQLLHTVNDELTDAAVGVRCDKNSNLVVSSHWGLKPGSTFTKMLANLKPLDAKTLAELPGGPFVMAGATTASQQLIEGYAQLMKSMPSLQFTPEQLQKLSDQMVQNAKGLKTIAFQLGVPTEGSGLFQNSSAVMHLDNAEQYVANIPERMKQTQAIMADANLPGNPKYESKLLEIDGAKAVEVSVDMAAMFPAGTPGNPQAILAALLGTEGKLDLTYVAVNKQTLFATYNDAKAAQEQLAAFKAGSNKLTANPQVAKTLALLTPNANAVGLWDLSGTATLAKQVAAKFAPNGSVQLPDVPEMPPLGFGLTASSQAINTELVLPFETIQTTGAIVQGVLGNMLRRPARLRRNQPGANPFQPPRGLR